MFVNWWHYTAIARYQAWINMLRPLINTHWWYFNPAYINRWSGRQVWSGFHLCKNILSCIVRVSRMLVLLSALSSIDTRSPASGAVNIRCSPQITHKASPRPPDTVSLQQNIGHYAAQVSGHCHTGHCEAGEWSPTVKCFLDSQKERLSKCQIGCTPEKLTLYWATRTCTVAMLCLLLRRKHGSSASRYSF